MPEDNTGWYPTDWLNPADDPELHWIEPADDDHPDPVPPQERLDEEPGWDIQAEDRGQNDAIASLLRGFLPPEADEAHIPPGARQFVQPGFTGLDLRDYSKLPDQKGWGAPCAAAHATVTLTYARVTVDARIAELVGLVMRACESRGYIFRAVDTGAYNCRKIAGTTTWSNHAWGLAVDCNWQSNPYTTGTTHDIPDWMHNLWNRYGFAWGGDYTGSRRDYMHFEFMGTPQQALLALALARAELAGITPAPTPPVPTVDQSTAFPYDHTQYFGLITGPTESHGGIDAVEKAYVRYIQVRLQQEGFAPGTAGWADGVYEQETVDAAAAWQHAKMPGTTKFGEIWWDDWAVLVNRQATPAPAPTPAPPPAPPHPPHPPGNFPYPHNHCFGLITDPRTTVHGGINVIERAYVKWIQQVLIFTGNVGGISDYRNGWADGRWEGATSLAMSNYQHRMLPRTTIFGQCWWDDFADLQRR
jgi:hypothetical protein